MERTKKTEIKNNHKNRMTKQIRPGHFQKIE